MPIVPCGDVSSIPRKCVRHIYRVERVGIGVVYPLQGPRSSNLYLTAHRQQRLLRAGDGLQAVSGLTIHSNAAATLGEEMRKPDRKLIFSRKGFDSGYGKIPSPILPDGRLVPLPIPREQDPYRMADAFDDPDLVGQLLSDLSREKHSLDTHVHIDPDLSPGPRRRPPGWRPALGQTMAAQSHLAGQGVGPGSVFLFFGWFRQVERLDGRWRYVRSAENLHVLFGWLEVSEVLALTGDRQACLRRHPWIAQHPHMAGEGRYADPLNTLYIAPERSRIVPGRSGGGPFQSYDPALRLTEHGKTRSVWSLPSWFMPKGRRRALSYHGDTRRWQRMGSRCRLRTVAKGQEFVLNLSEYPEAGPWLKALINVHGR